MAGNDNKDDVHVNDGVQDTEALQVEIQVQRTTLITLEQGINHNIRLVLNRTQSCVRMHEGVGGEGFLGWRLSVGNLHDVNDFTPQI